VTRKIKQLEVEVGRAPVSQCWQHQCSWASCFSFNVCYILWYRTITFGLMRTRTE